MILIFVMLSLIKAHYLYGANPSSGENIFLSAPSLIDPQVPT